jgi:hypothetical protein
VIVTYPDCSDCRAETIYGDGSLWVYASMTGPNSASSLLLRVSETTGRVAQRWRTALCRIAPGMRAPRRVLAVGLDGARWLAAAGHTIWLDAGPVKGPDSPRLWRFDGPNATPTLRAAPTPGGTRVCGDLGDGPVTVLGSATGVYCVTNTGSFGQSVSWLGRDGRSGAVVARASAPIRWDFADNAVTDHGSYYFIDPPASFFAGGSPNETHGSFPAMIYRVTPRP